GPVKYAILPDHLREEELVSGTGLVEAGTFLAILTGMLLGGSLIRGEYGAEIVTLLILGAAGTGYTASRFIPPAGPAKPDLSIRYSSFAETWATMKQARTRRSVFLSTLRISWFWLVGAMFIAQFPSFCKDVLHSNEEVVNLFLAVFS